MLPLLAQLLYAFGPLVVVPGGHIASICWRVDEVLVLVLVPVPLLVLAMLLALADDLVPALDDVADDGGEEVVSDWVRVWAGVVVVADPWVAEEAACEALVVEASECSVVVELASWTTGDEDATTDGGVVDDGADDEPTGP